MTLAHAYLLLEEPTHHLSQSYKLDVCEFASQQQMMYAIYETTEYQYYFTRLSMLEFDLAYYNKPKVVAIIMPVLSEIRGKYVPI